MTEVKNEYQPVSDEILEGIHAYVAYAKQMFAEEYEFDFGYNQESIEALDLFINTIREQSDEDTKSKIINIIGSFLGEALISNHGGNWAYYPEGDLGVNLRDGAIMASPHAKVEKHISNGEEDSILFFYKVISKKLAGEF